MRAILIVAVLAVSARASEWSVGAGPSFPANDVDLSRKGRATSDGWSGSVRWLALPELALWDGLGLGFEANGRIYNAGSSIWNEASQSGGAVWSGHFLTRIEPLKGKLRPYAIIAPGACRTASFSHELQFTWYWSAGVAFGDRWFVAPEYREVRTKLDHRAYSRSEIMAREAVVMVGVRL